MQYCYVWLYVNIVCQHAGSIAAKSEARQSQNIKINNIENVIY